MYKEVAVIGDKDSIYGFSSVGAKVYFTENKEDGAKKFKDLCGGDYAVIFITEALAEEIKEEVLKALNIDFLSIIPIPGVFGNTGMGINNIKKSVEKAVGADILFNDK